MSEWQPIETAPKDGTQILAKMGQAVFLVEWDESYDGYQGAWVVRMPGVLLLPEALEFSCFTDWMPVPDGSATLTRKEDE